MKCPKCGFNSFECLDTCKKCSSDLTAFKGTHGLKPIVLQMETRAAMVAAMTAEAAQSAASKPPEVPQDDMFSFDVPDEVQKAPAKKLAAADDFFNFSEKAAETPSEGFGDVNFGDVQDTKKTAPMDDAFANLLESTPSGISATAQLAASASKPGTSLSEFELDSFSWDETPESPAASGKKPVDDFDSLFGEISDSTKK